MVLPTELIIQISHYLSVNDKRNGLIVCRDWYEAFRLGLYHEILITNNKQLHSLLYSLHNNTHPIPHGHLVKRLYINKQPDQGMIKTEGGMVLDQEVFQQLPLLCPYLEVLDFDPASWQCITCISEIKNTWSHSMRQIPTLTHLSAVSPFLTSLGKHLTYMSISSSIMTLGDHGLESLLVSVPNLQHLEFIPLDTTTTTIHNHNYQIHPFIITVTDVEAIHRLVPDLQSLKITGNNVQMPTIDLETVNLDTLIPFESIRTLYINIPQLDISWLLYVSQKYPYVKDLALNLNYNNITDNDGRYDPSLLYTSLLSKCNSLQYLQLGSPDIRHWLNPTVLQHIIERTCIRTLTPFKREEQIKTDHELRTAVEYGRDIMTGLGIEQWRLNNKIHDTVRLLYAFSKLTQLDFRCDSYNDEYRLVDILDTCRHLKSLSLEWGTVITSPCIHKYSLESITMTYVAFDDTFFSQFLATHCPSLTHISLSKCKQLCMLNNIKTMIEIKIPQLVTLSIHNVRLEYSSASLFYHNATNYIRILELNDIAWYHHVGYNRYPIMNTLDRVDIIGIQHYLDHPSLLQLSHQKWSDTLKTDLMFGHISVQCPSIRHLFFDGNAQSR